ncbi:MAG: hypothetical protein ACREXR_04060, partial [Gammaproteobacteria bacterium]
GVAPQLPHIDHANDHRWGGHSIFGVAGKVISSMGTITTENAASLRPGDSHHQSYISSYINHDTHRRTCPNGPSPERAAGERTGPLWTIWSRLRIRRLGVRFPRYEKSSR